MAAGLPVEFFAFRQGIAQKSYDLTPFLTAANWTTNAVGGFGSLSMTLPGGTARWRKELPKLSIVRATYGGTVIWEGQVEDHTLDVAAAGIATTVQCFGLARLLAEASVKRIWSMRDAQWIQSPGGVGAALGASTTLTTNLIVSTGKFDPTNLARGGVQVAGNSVALVLNQGNMAEVAFNAGLTIVKLLASLTVSGANTGAAKLAARLLSSSDGSTWTNADATATNATFSQALVASANRVRIGAVALGAITPTATDLIQWDSIRLLGTTLNEDVAGGFFGGTILTDLLALVPGLKAGVVDAGSDFTIPAIHRAVRDAALNVVTEVASYYQTREWAVWEDGRFDWKAITFDGADVYIDLSQCTQLTLTDSTDPTERTSYILYTDAASGIQSEASTVSTKRTNPYARLGRAKDGLTSAAFPMTANTATQLSAVVNANRGARPAVSGQITVPASLLLSGRRPMIAAAVRAGMNIQIGGLPKDEPFVTGRDGQTLFHIVSTDATLDGNVTFQLDSQTRTIDVILARLAAVTRVITG